MRPAIAAAALLTAALAGAGASHWLSRPAPAEAGPPTRGEMALDTAARLAGVRPEAQARSSTDTLQRCQSAS